ncbi:hypothetical protein HJG54_19615 [Leptolyngbya sp. NK1-12]|uniref:Uncharacterized protein n=1 Tax=Leptolyngbya sp. NK1-12 TaxID=2547451 RepID=A0AA96WNA9_9CYAN|nr:hypothetical protein [Leptolyngbya sp. NK1-12]WNZ24836.1 hypothetical protein HJG54_19615 [Leptolyngbya sp. NK1-12]
MNENSTFNWAIYRNNTEHSRAVSYQQVQQIIRHARRIFPRDKFTARYNGKNLGVRRSEEYCG